MSIDRLDSFVHVKDDLDNKKLGISGVLIDKLIINHKVIRSHSLQPVPYHGLQGVHAPH